MIKNLVLSKADINLKNKEGKSALSLANEIGDEEVLNVLKHPESYSSSKKELSKPDETNKYTDTLEYLYPWVNNNYAGFKMTKSLSSIQKFYFMELQIRIDNPINYSDQYGYNSYYGYYRDRVMENIILQK
ncbi:hypothetical protein PIROE2DRAFT_66917 [Piromyces sp. E2]|nr:hypothetical protein PIROE2DRAFT_66917 [Piromyces sp. E2]|eukprot:OUM68579.1 hypothetical protein PIROE2DRAFT_66917 [Piromyces sp. E2]